MLNFAQLSYVLWNDREAVMECISKHGEYVEPQNKNSYALKKAFGRIDPACQAEIAKFTSHHNPEKGITAVYEVGHVRYDMDYSLFQKSIQNSIDENDLPPGLKVMIGLSALSLIGCVGLALRRACCLSKPVRKSL